MPKKKYMRRGTYGDYDLEPLNLWFRPNMLVTPAGFGRYKQVQSDLQRGMDDVDKELAKLKISLGDWRFRKENLGPKIHTEKSKSEWRIDSAG